MLMHNKILTVLTLTTFVLMGFAYANISGGINVYKATASVLGSVGDALHTSVGVIGGSRDKDAEYTMQISEDERQRILQLVNGMVASTTQVESDNADEEEDDDKGLEDRIRKQRQ